MCLGGAQPRRSGNEPPGLNGPKRLPSNFLTGAGLSGLTSQREYSLGVSQSDTSRPGEPDIPAIRSTPGRDPRRLEGAQDPAVKRIRIS